MIRRILKMATMLGALLPVMTISTMAQSRELMADIPFSFTVCTQTLPAGKYKVLPLTSATTNLLLVRSEDNRSAEITCTHDISSRKPASGGKLIFNRYGDQYFLSELWFSGEITGHQTFKSDREEALIREVGPKVKRVTVNIKTTDAKPK